MNMHEHFCERWRAVVGDDQARPVYCVPRDSVDVWRRYRAGRVRYMYADRFRRSRRWTRTYDPSGMPW